MSQGDYDEENRVKASFDAAYTAPTPHQYLHNMTAVDYRMADYMNPLVSAVVDASLTTQEPARVLDLGCSYGISGALLKADCSYQELVEFFRHVASSEYVACVGEAKRWLESHALREDVEVVGVDKTEEAISWLDDAIEERAGLLIFLGTWFPLDPLRSDPRFQALLKKMNFPAQPHS